MTHDRRTFLQTVGAGSLGLATLPLFSDAVAAATLITIRGGGADIWNTEDAFHYSHDEFSGTSTFECAIPRWNTPI
ncbi:hypothetical protein [Natrialba taiwanensis]|uniref:hypothetical protein n=1 Tax=Natrialba taiwanensis TaxID=160846 RepID=UPI000677A82B|nr:hypothetical protein [Natrialba taiwanensis]